ncbi:MAG: hypothetical protein ABIV47_02680 [Roseiflexaceae bacterium]
MPAYSSSEAAQMLSIAPITLRKLSTAFAAWLSPSAAGNVMVDELWDRIYNDDDLDTLRYIITLLKQKRNYAWVRERLTVEFGSGDLDPSNDQTDQEQIDQPEQPVSQLFRAEACVVEPEAPAPDKMPHAESTDRFEQHSPPPDDAPHVVEAEVVEPEAYVPPDIATMLARMADLYQELLHNKEQEISALRQALDVTELSAANERRELEMASRLTKMMERENQRLTTELEEARHQLGQTHARRGLFARLFGGDEEASSASHSQV